MSAQILSLSLDLALLMLGLALLLAAWRMVRGPRAQDRILGLDTLYLNGMLFAVVFGIRDESGLYFEAALVIGMLGFTATVALAKFLMRGEVIE